jgi:hypothetical protein
MISTNHLPQHSSEYAECKESSSDYQRPFNEPYQHGDVVFDQATDDLEYSHSDTSDIVRLGGYLITGGRVCNPADWDAS